MHRHRIVLVKAVTYREGTTDGYSVDFDEARLGESLSISYLKAWLNQHHKQFNVQLFNPLTQPPASFEATAAPMLTPPPLFLGISLIYQYHKNFALALARAMKAISPNTHVALGGFYPTSDWHNLLVEGNGAIDSICIGEGEQTFTELVQTLYSGGSWQQVPGLAYLHANGTPVKAGKRLRLRQLGQLPLPDRSQTPHILAQGGVVQVEASRGCNAGCTFCDARHSGWIGRPPNHIINELVSIDRQFPNSEVWFIDNIFLGFGKQRFERAHQIVDGILQHNLSLTFSIQDRADNVEFDLFSKLKRAGLQRLYIGVESFAPTALARWQKKANVAVNIKALQILKQVGIFTHIGFLVFDHGTTMQELRQNIDGLQATAKDNGWLHLHNFNELIPYGGTHLETEYIQAYGHKPDLTSTNLWAFTDARIQPFRDHIWAYLIGLWPLTEFIWHNHKKPELQQILRLVIATKNNAFLHMLEALYKAVQTTTNATVLTALVARHHMATYNALHAVGLTSTHQGLKNAIEAANGSYGQQAAS